MNNGKAIVALIAGIVLGGIIVGVGLPMISGVQGERTRDQEEALWKGEASDCGPGMNQAQLDEALDLGTQFLLNNQRPPGNFAYEWDWTKQQDSTGDNEVRQAGAVWGLALILQDDPTKTDVRDGLLKALDFWKDQSIVDPPAEEGAEASPRRRWYRYQGAGKGSTGTVALMTLAHIELLRSGTELAPERKAELEEHLDQLLNMLRAQRAPEGGFFSYFQITGDPYGRPNPYADGEALLALVKAANHLGRSDLLPDAVRWAKEDQIRNVKTPRATDPDPDTTKGYYQWTSMAWWELAHSAEADSGPYGEWLMELATWMIDDHHTLRRRKNTAYAYEGIVSAYGWAKKQRDPRAAKFKCVIDQGLRKLTSWQLGHSLANDFVKKAKPEDARGWGGVQNAKDEAPLRIDVTQHQMHAIILARRHYL